MTPQQFLTPGEMSGGMKTVHSNLVQGFHPDTETILRVQVQREKIETHPLLKIPGEGGWSSAKNIRELHSHHGSTSARSLIAGTEPDFGSHPDRSAAGRRQAGTQLSIGNTLTPQGDSSLADEENMKNAIPFPLVGLHGTIP